VLNLYRRHLADCKPGKKKGRAYVGCSCPIWCDGNIDGGPRVMKSLEMRDWQRALRKKAEMEDPDAPRVKTVADAVTAFEQHILPLEASTQRKYKNVLRHFRNFCEGAGARDMVDVKVDQLDAYRAGRALARTTTQKELETLRQFFAFCFERRWATTNPAKSIKSAKNVKPAEVRPYAADEITRVIAACDVIGKGSYERLRARAMVLLLNNTALRVCDVATLERARVRDGRILVRTTKTGDTVYLEVWPETQNALDALSAPRGCILEPRYYFWNGRTSKRAVVGIAERALAAVFKKSGVPDAHAHRFRHTLATRLLGNGGTEQEVADILGNSPNIVRKHYAKWSQARQKRIDALMRSLNAAPTPAIETGARVN
jgi:site-specific recombinase XerD